jgi:hypothetical protein
MVKIEVQNETLELLNTAKIQYIKAHPQKTKASWDTVLNWKLKQKLK